MFVFLVLIRLQSEPFAPEVIRVPGGKWVAVMLGCIGLVTTLGAIGLALIPAAAEPNKPLAVLKILGLTATLLVMGWTIYALSKRKGRAEGSTAI